MEWNGISDFLNSFSRFILPLLAFMIVVINLISLFKNRMRLKTMAYLVNAVNGDQIPLDHFETSIGRSKSCDIVLNYPMVSRSHAVISKRPYGWVVYDIFSKTGVYVNNEKISRSQKIYDADSIAFGNIVMYFKSPEYMPKKKKKSGRDAAVHVSPAEFTDINSHSETVPLSITGFEDISSISAGGRNKASLYDVTRDTEIKIKGYENIIGKSFDCDIILNSDTVAREHAKIILRDGIWILYHSAKGFQTFVNGEPVTRHYLNNGDEIDIGGHGLVFRLNP